MRIDPTTPTPVVDESTSMQVERALAYLVDCAQDSAFATPGDVARASSTIREALAAPGANQDVVLVVAYDAAARAVLKGAPEVVLAAITAHEPTEPDTGAADQFAARRAAEDAAELHARLDPSLRDAWCWGNTCRDTNWGGRGRRHLRGDGCTPVADSPITRPDDPRLVGTTLNGQSR